MLKIKNLFFLISILFFITGCSFKGYEYKGNLNIVNDLNDKNLNQVDVVKVSNNGIKNDTSLPLRAVSMTSPYGDSFSDYISSSLKSQLSLNNLYNSKSNIKIYTKLLKNEVDIWGFSTASYDLSAQFVIRKDDTLLYDKVIQVKHQFPSHFVGQIAIENGMRNYPIVVKKLITKFLSDENALEVLKKGALNK
ncbi:hypothetical protein [Arcobacter sp.]|uniref:hypothetical protein n=1 Tax=Arcobacter sp. TaxID=1872629 RepID=UPI003C73A58C